MSKISTYSLADEPLQLSDRLIGTEAPRPNPSPTPLATKNFSLGELLQLFSQYFPADTLQAVLDAGNIATQNITLTGTINTTVVKPTNIEDILGSQGTNFQFLSKATSGINWVNLPVDNLQAVLNAGNTATQNINLTGNITSTRIIPGNIQDYTTSIGTTGQVLTKSTSGIVWSNLPASTTPGLNDVLLVGNTSLQNANIGELGLWDSANSNYISIGTTDQGVTFNVPSVGEIFVAQNDVISFGNGGLASITNNLLTASRVYQLPNASGTIALTSNIPSAITLTTTGTSGPSTLIGSVLNIPIYAGGSTYTFTSPLVDTAGVITINQSNATTNGYLSSTDWNTFNGKQNTITLTTTGSGVATFISNVLNIPTPPTATFTSLTTTGSSGSSTLIAGVLNVPTYTLAGLGGQAALSGTGIVKSTAGTISYINGTTAEYVRGDGSLATFPTITGGTVTSVGLSMPSAFTVSNSPITSSGTIAVTGAGLASQYVRGDGTLATFPTSSGGGSSFNYYLNGSISQGTFGGDTYYQMSRTPILGAGTNFTRTNGAGNGYIASFITDAGDPSLLNIPGGNWNLEFYFQASSGGGSPQFYGEIYKVSATNVFTLVASGSANPEGITNGTTVDQYFTSIPVPQTSLLITDRIAIRIYVITGGRTITLHTENGNLCEVLTTFSTGLTALNGLTSQVQYLAVGTSGTDFNISSVTDTHTFNLPTASATNRGALSSTDWSTFNGKQNAITLTVTGNSGSSTLAGSTLNIPTYTLAGLGGQPQLNGTGFVKASGTTISYDNTTYYPNPTGTTAQYVRGDGSLATFPTIPGGTVTSVAALTLGTSGTDLSSTVANPTTTPVITLNVPTASATNRGALSSADWTTFNSKFTLPSLTNGSVIFSNGTTLAENNANFFWDDSNSRLGLGTTTPSAKLHVDGSMFLLDSATGVSTITFPNGPQIEANGPGGYFKSGLVHSSLFGPTAGNVGIGTTSPSAKLDVSGVIRGVLPDPSGVGGITAKLLSYSPSPYGLVFRGYSSGAHSIQSQRESNDAQMYPLILQPNGSNVGIGTVIPSALLDVNGDALINGITVGRGAGNDASNTVIGKDAFFNNLSGQQNTVVGYSAGGNLTSGDSNVFVGQSAGININSGSGNTIIGTLNSFPPTGAPADFSDTLSISKGESNYGTFLPHIWAPAVISTSSTATIISAAAGSYRAMFVEYIIEDENGNIRGGYIKGIWNNDLSVIKMTEDTTSSIGVTSDYVFDIVDGGGSNAALQITSLSTDNVYCSVTSRLLTRPY